MSLISPKDYNSRVTKEKVHSYADAKNELYTQLFWMRISCCVQSYLSWMIVITPSPLGRGFILWKSGLYIKIVLGRKSFTNCFNEQWFWKEGDTETQGEMKFWLTGCHDFEKHLSQKKSNLQRHPLQNGHNHYKYEPKP